MSKIKTGVVVRVVAVAAVAMFFAACANNPNGISLPQPSGIQFPEQKSGE
ncbi:MAG: hypothetical protein ACR2OV_03785 [Hyphomicrobiaceae bacterium]